MARVNILTCFPFTRERWNESLAAPVSGCPNTAQASAPLTLFCGSVPGDVARRMRTKFCGGHAFTRPAGILPSVLHGLETRVMPGIDRHVGEKKQEWSAHSHKPQTQADYEF
jgi:hypothetical protein